MERYRVRFKKVIRLEQVVSVEASSFAEAIEDAESRLDTDEWSECRRSRAELVSVTTEEDDKESDDDPELSTEEWMRS